MAFMDYGALCRKDGVLINRDNFFMDVPEGFPKKVLCGEKEVPVEELMGHGILGDPDFFVIFYKGSCNVAEDGKLAKRHPFYQRFLSETFFYEKADLTVSLLDREKHFGETLKDVLEDVRDFEGFCKELGGIPGGKRRYLQRQIRALARRRRNRSFWTHSQRWKCAWEKGGHKYEAIFGFMVDPKAETWSRLRKKADFSKEEVRIIDEWFG